ncbi:hypothetical protein ACFO4N_00200 [Camelliibacillus cellulosilyticus]|uniref:YkoP-like domain-containing protein n=1 Tax=Camelliibacillus cellulosilyticus TaxID=2174486 RepID=A0ABV9GJ95_9BACL
MGDKDTKETSIKGFRKVILAIYSVWERLYYKIAKVRVENSHDLLYIRPIIYKGRPIQLEDMTIEKGDAVLQLHFNNRLLLETALRSKNTMHMITTLLHIMRDTLQRLAEYVQSPEFEEYKALYGISLMHRGAEQFGFNVIDLKSGVSTSFQQFYLRLLMRILHPNGRKRLKIKKELLAPKVVAVSRKRFIENNERKKHRS